MALPEYERVLDRLQIVETEKATLTERLAKADVDWRVANERIAELNREIGELYGMLQERRPAAYWLRIVVIVAVIGVLLTVAVFLLARGA